MPRDTEVDVMSLLLNDEVQDDIQEVEQLNCLIYSHSDNLIESEPGESQKEPAWNTENERLNVHVWESKGKIRIKVLAKPKKNVSIQRLAEVALNAIMEDLKKDTP